MDTGMTLSTGGLITAFVALLKAGLPGNVSSRAVWALVLVVSGVVTALALWSGMLAGLTPFQIAGQWALQAAAAVGIREGVVVVAPQVSALPSR